MGISKDKNYISMNSIRNKSQEERTKACIHNAKLVHGDKYDYSKTIYENDKSKLIIICPIHGEFYQSYNDHVVSYHECPECKDKVKLIQKSNEEVRLKSKENFFSRMKEIYNDFYDLSEFEYVNTNTDGKLICPIHGEFYKCPNKLINRRQSCAKCTANKHTSRNELMIEEFLNANSIKFTRNKENLFEECISRKGNYLDFDFYIEDKNILIEFDGSQHFKTKFNNTVNDLEDTHDRDIRRNSWALDRDVIFIRFSYQLTLTKLEQYLRKIIIDEEYTIYDERVYVSKDHRLLGKSSDYYKHYYDNFYKN
jgi:very-short-patch-repair endonuclease/uncharacterized protein YbaR (Trm112 family)